MATRDPSVNLYIRETQQKTLPALEAGNVPTRGHNTQLVVVTVDRLQATQNLVIRHTHNSTIVPIHEHVLGIN